MTQAVRRPTSSRARAATKCFETVLAHMQTKSIWINLG